MPKSWIFLFVLIFVVWNIISAVIQQMARKQEQERQRELASQQPTRAGRTPSAPGPTSGIRLETTPGSTTATRSPTAAGRTHAETLAERRRAQLEELRGRRQQKATGAQVRLPGTQPTTPPVARGPVPIPLQKPTRAPTRAPSPVSSGKKIKVLDPGLASARADSGSRRADVERRKRDKREQERIRELRNQAEQRAARAEQAREAQQRSRRRAKPTHEETHRLVADSAGPDPYAVVSHAKDQAHEIQRILANPMTVRSAIVLTEVLGPPVSLRQ